MTKDEMQESALSAWVANDYVGTLLLGTGTGKSFTAIKALKYLLRIGVLRDCKNVLIAVSDVNLRDVSWETEFKKLGMTESYSELTIECYQTTANFVDRSFDLIIADEFDFALTPAYSQLFLNNSYGAVLGLTGFIDSTKLKLANEIAPVVFDFSTGKAQVEGMLNKSVLVGVSYELSTVKDVTITHKGGEFKTSENDQYAYLEKKVAECSKAYYVALSSVSVKPSSAQRMEIADCKRAVENATRYRAAFLYSCKSSERVAQRIKDEVLAVESNKVLVFSQRKESSDIICSTTYNGDLKKAERKIVLDKLNSGEIRDVGLCKALDRGANLEGINAMIFHTFTSSKTSFRQRHGRGCRLHKNALMYFYVLVPWYKKRVVEQETQTIVWPILPTKQRGWAVSMLGTFTPHETISINLGEV